ncbi:ATPase, AAA-type, core [Metarhizium rileyi]|uniref:ATPase, AAA-type, core n=1 Tax=Metarhizium rileyi (strain RCEF 4871) TaxID=1649241 RepID=A0A167D0T6_METRR|nr:ATPase, AAA-type, core [Metarhizium rileyi RCEF 4871]
MKSLLEAIHALQDQVDILGKSLKEVIPQPSPKPPPSQQAQYIVLHQVFCDQSDHCHNKAVYEDAPRYDVGSGWGFNDILKGQVPIFNVGTYLSQRSAIHFVVFKEYSCVADNLKTKEREIHSAESISERQERLWLVSRPLREATRMVAKFKPGNQSAMLANIEQMDAPYNFFFHHHQRFSELATAERAVAGSSYRDGLESLLSFLDHNYGAEYKGAKAMFDQGRVSTVHLNKLFRPGQIVVATHQKTGQLRAGILDDCRLTITGGVVLRGWSWNYDGKQLRRATWSGAIDAIAKNCPIIDLAIYPLDFASDETKAALEDRGARFWRARHGQYVSYNRRDEKDGHYTVTRLMVDVPTYFQLHACDSVKVFGDDEAFTSDPGGSSYESSVYDDWPVSIDNSQAQIRREMLMLLPPNTVGYDMHQKKWGQFSLVIAKHPVPPLSLLTNQVAVSVDDFSDMVWGQHSIDKLFLDRKKKDILLGFVGSRKTTTVEYGPHVVDLIKGKEELLIIHLHGPPGAGKTIAEDAERPLFTIHSGHMGMNLEEIEAYLDSVLQLANKWDCVLLVNEADAFLGARDEGDFRNAAVMSVFLRFITQASGIVVLSTSRVATLDQTFQSHINFSITLGDLTRENRRQIWDNLLVKLIGNYYEDDYKETLDELAAKNMSGRQIRNAVARAFALARHQGDMLKTEHIFEAMAV